MSQQPIDFGSFSNRQIREYYDLHPNLTILTYAGMLGLTGKELKDILMEAHPDKASNDAINAIISNPAGKVGEDT